MCTAIYCPGRENAAPYRERRQTAQVMIKVTAQQVRSAQSGADYVWTFGDRVLYDLCESRPGHRDREIAIAKSG